MTETLRKSRVEQKIDAYFNIVETIASLSMSSSLKVGCMALKKDFTKIASFGYNGSYINAPNNPETGTEEDSLEPGKSGLIHAEINMVAKFREHDPENYIIMLTDSPCINCMKVLINSGFKHVYWLNTYRCNEHLSIMGTVGMTYGNRKDLVEHFLKDFNGI